MSRYRASCDCGWTGTYTSDAKARYALRKHSCEKQRDLAERLGRGRTRRAGVDRTPKLCAHKIARHQHGTHACYVLDRCKCPPCTKANAAYEKQRVRLQAYGRWNGLVDAEPSREHVAALRAQGLGLKRIALLSGVPHGTLWNLVYGKPGRGPSRRVKPDTERRLLTVTTPDVAGGQPVAGVGTRRRLQALVAIGWSITKLGKRLGITNIHRTIHGYGNGMVLASTAKAARALYDDLWDQSPPEKTHRDKIAAARSRRLAAEYQWPSPLAWDDDEIDDPYAEPRLDVEPDTEAVA